MRYTSCLTLSFTVLVLTGESVTVSGTDHWPKEPLRTCSNTLKTRPDRTVMNEAFLLVNMHFKSSVEEDASSQIIADARINVTGGGWDVERLREYYEVITA